MKESDRIWNQEKAMRRVDNVNHSMGVRVNGKPLFEGQPRFNPDLVGPIGMHPNQEYMVRRGSRRVTRSGR